MFGIGPGKPDNTYYYGSEANKYISELMDCDGDILIVSPYIDRYYAEILLRKSRGKRFYVIASSLEEDVLKLLRGKPSLLWVASYAALSVAMLCLMLFIHVSGAYLLISAVPFAIGMAKNVRRKSHITLKVPKQFVHAKTYVSDSMAITGSANLTYKGTFRNVEQISITHSKDEIERLKKQFWSMWKGL